MWLSFDTCSSYAWSKIIKHGYLLSERAAGQRGFGGDREQQQEVTWQQTRPAEALRRGRLRGITTGKSPVLLLVLRSCWSSSPAQARHRAHPQPCPSACRGDGMLRYLPCSLRANRKALTEYKEEKCEERRASRVNPNCCSNWEVGRAPCPAHQGRPCLRACGEPPGQGCRAAVPHQQRPSAKPQAWLLGKGSASCSLKPAESIPGATSSQAGG